MARMIFVNLPVSDVARAVAFYSAIGATEDDRYREGDAGAAVRFSDTIYFMLLSHARFADFAPAGAPQASATAQMLITLSEDSREALDATVARAVALGGTADPAPVEDYGWMYGRGFTDPDGHMIGLAWMDMEAAMAATAGQGVAA
ncbi:VOC family protein [Sphingomonas jatrophae]|uniref:VOC domain-containing protein n=1 Tax=Sphingomonas jatrophae TaxID=1166337 RepID=A0A1I6LHX4_9SPHN|nr:VOC family protein [Sphingomonas jatrophae]SFS03061.1 hypothetical protein SAMN05192580_2759 [Sphingomonas jatrophae]